MSRRIMFRYRPVTNAVSRSQTMKTYLGDGVYFEAVDGQIVLTTSNGISTTNTIYLEPKVVEALLRALADVYDPSLLISILNQKRG